MKKRDHEAVLEFFCHGRKGEKKRVSIIIGNRLVRCDCILAADHAVDSTPAPIGGRTRLRQISVNSKPQWASPTDLDPHYLERGIPAEDVQTVSRGVKLFSLPVKRGSTIEMEVEFLVNATWEATIYGLLRETSRA